MAIKPILFDSNAVRAILEDRKTCARKFLKQPFTVHPNGYITRQRGNESLCPYDPPYEPGDILYVRESFYEDDNCVLFRADNEKLTGYRSMRGEDITVKWRPSSNMPKDIARIWIKVTDVRVERLQDITLKQIEKEGVVDTEYPYALNGEEKMYAFSNYWNGTIRKEVIDLYGWVKNPYVWVIEFERCDKQEEDKRCD